MSRPSLRYCPFGVAASKDLVGADFSCVACAMKGKSDFNQMSGYLIQEVEALVSQRPTDVYRISSWPRPCLQLIWCSGCADGVELLDPKLVVARGMFCSK